MSRRVVPISSMWRPGGWRRVGVVLALAVLGLGAAAISPANVANAATADSGRCSGTDMMGEVTAGRPDLARAIAAGAEATANTEALLWRIERAGRAPSYLFGTIHLTDARVSTLSPKVGAALERAKAVALEIADLSPAAMQGAMLKAPKLLTFNDGRRLDGMLTPEEFERVKAVLGSNGMPGEVAPLFRPWIVYMMLSVSSCERQKVATGASVLDQRIAETARARGTPVIGLETVEGQLSAMASVPDEPQIQMLKAALKFASRTDDLMETVLQLYLKRNMGAAWPFQMALARLAGVDPGSLSVFQDKLVNERNLHMRDGALPLIEKGGAFIAVGALHLPGEVGLVKLFRDAGYSVIAVE